MRRITPTLLCAAFAGSCGGDAAPAQDPPASLQADAPQSNVEARPQPPTPAEALPAEAALVLPDALGDEPPGVAELERRFGARAVRVGDVPGPEGTTLRGATLFPDDPTRRAYLYAVDESASADAIRFESVRVFEPGSRWRLRSGIGVGSTLADVLRANGGPFDFGGAGWDYGGYALDWRGGKLANREGEPQPSVRFELTERFLLSRGEDGPMPMGEGRFRSDDPRWPDLDMRVSEIGVSYPIDGAGAEQVE